MPLRHQGGEGWLVLIGGGEFSFGETLEVDRAWLDKVPAGLVGFLPTASGSTDYGRHFAAYLSEVFERQVSVIPIYRSRDARRRKNLERIAECEAIYIGGGVGDELLETLAETPAHEALGQKLGSGGVVVAIGAAAQTMGHRTRSMYGGESLQGFGWLAGGVVEPNFEPGHDRRLRRLMDEPGVQWGLGLPSGSAVLLGPRMETQFVGTSFLLDEADGDFHLLR